jgi:hypothetical protein
MSYSTLETDYGTLPNFRSGIERIALSSIPCSKETP